MLAVWGAGLLLEAALLLPAFIFLERPEPPLVARLRGDPGFPSSTPLYVVDTIGGNSPAASSTRAMTPMQGVGEDSFYTVLHWPPDKPLLAGGGRVIAVPMRFLWVPFVYVCVVPIGLLALAGAWLTARWRNRGPWMEHRCA
jgi:hypothetical protein